MHKAKNKKFIYYKCTNWKNLVFRRTSSTSAITFWYGGRNRWITSSPGWPFTEITKEEAVSIDPYAKIL